MMSLISAISQPPPNAKPFTAAMTGFEIGCDTMPAKPHANCAGSSGWRLSPRDSATRSAPAQKLLRSEEHTSELQSLMRHSYAVFCLKKQTKRTLLTRTHYSEHNNTHQVSNI